MTDTTDNNSQALLQRGRNLAAARQSQLSRECLEQAVALQPMMPGDVYALLSQQCLLTRDPRGAEVHASAGLERYPRDVACLEARAAARLALLEISGACADADLALTLRPESTSARLIRASIFMAQGNPNQALDMVTPLRDNAAALLIQAAAWMTQGDPARAETCLKTAGELEPFNWQVYFALGGLEFARGRLELALNHLNFALYYGGEAPNVHRLRGMTLFRLGRFPEAKQDFLAGAVENPSDACCWLALAEIESREPTEQLASREHAQVGRDLAETPAMVRWAERLLKG